ncbi:MAG: hypothetical protein COB85_08235, partial [Bacteroidetes bacterium]
CSPQGTWTAFSILLPASANNNDSVKIGFNWTNNDDGVGTDPSVAIDDITLSTIPPLDTATGLLTVCVTDTSSYTLPSNIGSVYNWTLPGGGGSIISGQGTDSIAIIWGGTAGSFVVSVDEVNCSGTISHEDITVVVGSCSGPVPIASFLVSDTLVCEGTCISFADSSTELPTSWAWLFAGGTPSTSSDQNPASICYNIPGTYQVMLTATNGNGSNDTTMLSLIVVDTAASANAGVDSTICNNGTYTITGASISGSASSLVWTTSGSGTFDDSSLIGAVYTPSDPDTAAGCVVLTLTTNDPAGPCGSASDAMNLCFTSCTVPVASFAATSTLICQGSCINFNDSSSSSPTSWAWSFSGATPDTSNVQNPTNICYNTAGTFSVTLIATNGNGSDDSTMTAYITIDTVATVSAGTDDTICAGSAYTLSGSIGGSAASSEWTTTGDGLFDDSSLVAATYTPGSTDISSGSINLFLTTDDPAGPCGSAVDSILLTIDAVASVNAGVDDTICAGNTYPLAGSIGGSASSSEWTTAGDGSFDDSTLLAATYTPGSSDISGGSVLLILTSDDPSGPCIAAMDSVSLVITTLPVIDSVVAVDASACGVSDGTIDIYVSSGTPPYQYSIDGGSSFFSNGSFSGLSTGSYPISVIDTNGCAVIGGPAVITASGAPTAPTTGTDTSYCVGHAMADLTATSGSGGIITWYSDAGLTIILDTGSTLTPDTATGTTIYYVTETTGCEGLAATVTIIISALPAAPVAGTDSMYCEGNPMAILTAISGSGGSITWYSDTSLNTVLGTGTSLAPGTSLGSTIYYVTETVGSCESVANTVVITIDTCPAPTANFSPSSLMICTNGCINFNDLSSSNTTSWLWSFPGAIPLSDTTQNPGSICYAVAGTYIVTLVASNSNGSDTTTTSIVVSVGPVLIVSKDTTIMLGESVDLSASGADTYLWNTLATSSSIGVSPQTTSTYIVTGFDSMGCAATDSIVVRLQFNNVVFIPTVFSPGSGNLDNTMLYVFGSGIAALELVIYDRWGEIVFETAEVTQSLRFDGQCCRYGIGWDGTHKNSGKAINSAVFAYILKGSFQDGTEFNKQGNITLIK